MPAGRAGVLLAAVALSVIVLVVLLPGGGRRTAGYALRRAPIALFQEPSHILRDPAATLAALRALGVTAVRVQVQWRLVAPAATAKVKPAGFDGADPAGYPAAAWRPYDAIVTDARRDGVAVEFSLMGGVPKWALGPGVAPGPGADYWKPSVAEFGRFVHAIAERYSGGYRPVGTSAPLPAVRFWELWNEPNFGGDLAPQTLQGSRISISPALYRGLLDAGWGALGDTGHRHDRVIMGSLSPRGFNVPPSRRFPQGLPGYFSTTKPLQFLRTLYCLDRDFQPLRGPLAQAEGCPATAAGTQLFLRRHPALFYASGFGIHPYPFDRPPDQVDSHDPDYAEFGQLPRLATTLDRLQHAYSSNRRLDIYNTEFGYITDPPNATTHYGRHFVSPALAAYYLNWAEYLTWRQPRIATTMQYLLFDPDPHASGFATGLLFDDGRPKAGYAAYRMPLYLPVTSITPGQPVEVWGAVRPAHFAQLDAHGAPQRVQIQYRGASGSSFRTIAAPTIVNVAGYFDTRLMLPGAGSLRLAWQEPRGHTFYSRTVTVTERR